jgi:hypothetical protein
MFAALPQESNPDAGRFVLLRSWHPRGEAANHHEKSNEKGTLIYCDMAYFPYGQAKR